MEAITLGRRNGESWDASKSRAKALKSKLGAKLQELEGVNSRLAASVSGSTSGERVAELDGQIQPVVELRGEVEQGLKELEDTAEALSRTASTNFQSVQASNFREAHQEMSRDLKRISQSIEHQFQRARLLPKARGRAGASILGDAEEGLMRERGSLSQSMSMIDDVIASASGSRDSLHGQQSALFGMSSKMEGFDTKQADIKSLITRIGGKKNRERIVLSVTIASCCFFTVWYKFL